LSDGIGANLLNVMTPAELAEQRRLVQFHNYPWPLGPVIIEEVAMTENKKHCWICEDCPRVIMFLQPELPDDDPASEMNGDKNCPGCGNPMYFDEVGNV